MQILLQVQCLLVRAYADGKLRLPGGCERA
jgi:hypothetical protein